MKEYPTQKRLKELFDYRDDGQLIRKATCSGGVSGKVSGSIHKASGYRCI